PQVPGGDNAKGRRPERRRPWSDWQTEGRQLRWSGPFSGNRAAVSRSKARAVQPAQILAPLIPFRRDRPPPYSRLRWAIRPSQPTRWEAKRLRVRREPSFLALPAMNILLPSSAIAATVALVVKPRSKTASGGLISRATTSATVSG